MGAEGEPDGEEGVVKEQGARLGVGHRGPDWRQGEWGRRSEPRLTAGWKREQGPYWGDRVGVRGQIGEAGGVGARLEGGEWGPQ